MRVVTEHSPWRRQDIIRSDGRRAGQQATPFYVDIEISNGEDPVYAEYGVIAAEPVRTITARGVVDIGAMRLVLPAALVMSLGLTKVGKTRVRYPHRRSALLDLVGHVSVNLVGRNSTFLPAVEPKRESPIVGRIALNELDFIIDPLHQRLVPRDPDMIVSELE